MKPLLICMSGNRVQEIMQNNNPIPDNIKRSKILASLKGILRCGHCECPMMPTYGRKNGKKYFYYICENKVHGHVCPVKSLSAGTIEKMVREEMIKIFSAPDIIMSLAQETMLTVSVIEEFFKKDFWEALSPGEYARLFHLLLETVIVHEDKIEIELKTSGVKYIMEEFVGNA